MKIKEIRQRLNEYFGSAPHTVNFFRSGKKVIVDIEYEDFRSEPVVESEVRRIIGEDFFLSVKRECSESLYSEIMRFLSSDRNGEKTLQMMISNYFHLMDHLFLHKMMHHFLPWKITGRK